jgi:hypothetical protein
MGFPIPSQAEPITPDGKIRQMAQWTVVDVDQVEPGLPNYSIQYNQDQVFTGNAEYVIDPTSHILYLGAASSWVVKPITQVGTGLNLTLQGGGSTGLFVGGTAYIIGGTSGLTSSSGGGVSIAGAAGVGTASQRGGPVSIVGGLGSGTNGNGGSVAMAAGAGTGAGVGGVVNIDGGASGAGASAGGTVNITGGAGTNAGGAVSIIGGPCSGNPGARVLIQGGTGSGGGNGVTIDGNAGYVTLDADVGLFLTGSASVGTAGQLLTSNGAGAQPTWGNGPATLSELLVDSSGNILFDSSPDVLYQG